MMPERYDSDLSWRMSRLTLLTLCGWSAKRSRTSLCLRAPIPTRSGDPGPATSPTVGRDCSLTVLTPADSA